VSAVTPNPGPALPAIFHPELAPAFTNPHFSNDTSGSDIRFSRLFMDPIDSFSTLRAGKGRQDTLLISSTFTSSANALALDSVNLNDLSLMHDDSRFQESFAAPTATIASNTAGLIDISRTLADPITNSIQFAPVTFFSAMVNNALSLGFDVAKLLTAECVSPFHRLVTPQDDPKVLLASASNPTIPAHLQPTLPQILYSHPPYLDLLPYPLLRARLIVLTALMPHTFDHFDFKRDIYVNGGLVCWKTNGSAQPWDMRSWEAAPWFLSKWKMLVDGESGEIWKQSSWWWGLRDRHLEAI
jgi:hypothetical protein